MSTEPKHRGFSSGRSTYENSQPHQRASAIGELLGRTRRPLLALSRTAEDGRKRTVRFWGGREGKRTVGM